MIARTNRLVLLAIFALLMGFFITTSTGCPGGDDDDSASDDDDSAAVDDDDSAEQKMWLALALGILTIYVWDLKRQIDEVSEEVSRLHKDFLAEVYIRYGEDFDGEE